MQTTYQIDYLAGSDDTHKARWGTAIPKPSPAPFYKIMFRDIAGIQYHYGNPSSPRAYRVASSQALAFERSIGKSDSMQAYEAVRGGNVSRADLAMDIFIGGDMITVQDVVDAVAAGAFSCWLANEKISVIRGLAGGTEHAETLYIGDMRQRGSRGIVRVYDKGHEEGIGRNVWTRIEIERRGKAAHALAERIAQGEQLNALFSAALRFSGALGERLAQAEPADVSRGAQRVAESYDEQMVKRGFWLKNQVAPAFAEYVRWYRSNYPFGDAIQRLAEECGIMVATDDDEG